MLPAVMTPAPPEPASAIDTEGFPCMALFGGHHRAQTLRWIKPGRFSRGYKGSNSVSGYRFQRKGLPMGMPEAKFLKDHDLPAISCSGLKFEKRPARTPDGKEVPGLYNAWIWLDNPTQYNSYTTEMVKAGILAFRAASHARDVSSVVFTGVGDKAFCTGGNTKEYAEYYAGHPQEYRQYMRLFNDMVSAILACDKPVICRVNGMRIGGGQGMGMAGDFSVAQELARFCQAGPRHASRPSAR